MLPFGDYKGYGLALMFSFMSAALSGNGFDADQPDWLDAERPFGLPMFCLAVDAARCLGGDYRGAVDEAIRRLKSSRLAPGFDEIRIPGEGAHRRYLQALAEGVPVPEALLKEMARLAAQAGAPPLARGGPGPLP
jgi:LDH2 family malate/lactate/ureidoglycolate dehydrogenase